ncbi:permease prefix domain 1-containing protein [Bacillus mojavensis]|uniref:permease prefix domain 1-containing protein n=1 Tax=Bacillus mojavensis TaxID=72360 RepID=UPI002DBE76FC|nr:permease prefix domain 1-containing protein [Bacillus mojavensis]MEC1289692.1 permease prefix domain 1-containing protein [Bacillus mojavensis]MEC1635473.1 permease prefix domain 1-containing protein [Bacillus mojavensis]MEC1703054.1 permease prefix domain 1-containing protein [Bacillus mojavensis]MEC5248321.1 permease prefix domain 1-containing protein [Bacillus mojavensis]
MRQINAFVDSVYTNTVGSRKEIKELKAEMRNHLLEAVHELIAEGKSEKEAIEIAIDRFGGTNEMKSVVSGLFQIKTIFAKKLLFAALAFLVVSVILFGFIYVNEVKKDRMQEDYMMSIILNHLGKQKEITGENKKYMEDLIKNNQSVYEILLMDHKKIKSVTSNEEFQKLKPAFHVSKNIWTTSSSVVSFVGYSQGNENWDLNVTRISYRPLADTILHVGGVIYWVLFFVWALINAHHQRRLKAGWIFMFALFNVAGYLLFHVFGKKRKHTMN